MRICPSVGAEGGTEAVCVVPPAVVPVAAPVSVPVAAGAGGTAGAGGAVLLVSAVLVVVADTVEPFVEPALPLSVEGSGVAVDTVAVAAAGGVLAPAVVSVEFVT